MNTGKLASPKTRSMVVRRCTGACTTAAQNFKEMLEVDVGDYEEVFSQSQDEYHEGQSQSQSVVAWDPIFT